MFAWGELADSTDLTGEWKCQGAKFFAGYSGFDFLNNAGIAEGRWLLSEYDEEYVRVDGTWKFKKLRLDVKYYVPQLQDWALASIGNRIA